FLDVQRPKLEIVFGRTKRRVDELTSALIAKGYLAEGLHGDITQSKRLEVLKKFKNDALKILVPTDVAARGLDITGVTHVYNFDILKDAERYRLLMCRTSRAGESGVALTFVNPIEMGYLRLIEETKGKTIRPLRPPFKEEVKAAQAEVMIDKVRKYEGKEIDEEVYELSRKLVETFDPLDIITAFVSEYVNDKEEDAIQLSFEKPLPRRASSKQSSGKRKDFNRGKKNERNNRRKPNKRNTSRKKRSDNKTFKQFMK